MAKNQKATSSKRKASLQILKDNMMEAFGMRAPSASKRKQSLSKWNQFSTVSWSGDQKKDFEHVSSVAEESKAITEAQTWILPASVGICTACSGAFIEKGVEFFSDLRNGFCFTAFPVSSIDCPDAGWKTWPEIFPGGNPYIFAYVVYIGIAICLALTSAFLVWAFAPTARGSGIPEVKTVLGGFVMKDVLSANTLVVKIVGLCLSVSSGLALGKEGPLVHVACCWANVLSGFSARYRANEGKRRDLLSTAAAAGVSVAFGAPLGGVLFSYEEVSTMFPQKTMIRAFFAAIVAAMTLAWFNLTGTGSLTMFEVQYNHPIAFPEYAFFILIGISGGLIGALFVHCNVQVSTFRGTDKYKKNVHILLEVGVITLFSATLNFPFVFLKPLSTPVIHAMFSACTDLAAAGPAADPYGLCNGADTNIGSDIVCTIAIAAVIRWVQMTFTFGTGLPCGLFVPSLYTGACMGRIWGIIAIHLNAKMGFAPNIEPGVYSMIGAAAVLGGVCRVTISLVVIMFELTGGLQYVVPFMLSVLTAKAVGDSLTEGIYDCYIVLRGYPFLHEPDDVTYNTRACDVMDDELDCIYSTPCSLQEVITKVTTYRHGGYPLVKSEAEPTLLGYIDTQELLSFLNDKKSETFVNADTPVLFFKHSDPELIEGYRGAALDLSHLVDETVMRLVPETPVAQVHNIFRQLGVKLVLITRQATLIGLITKKSFITSVSHGKIGHPKSDPAVTGEDPTVVQMTQPAGMAEPLIRA